MAHQPPCGRHNATKLDLKRYKAENTLTKNLDSKVGCMRWVGATHGELLVGLIELDVTKSEVNVGRLVLVTSEQEKLLSSHMLLPEYV